MHSINCSKLSTLHRLNTLKSLNSVNISHIKEPYIILSCNITKYPSLYANFTMLSRLRMFVFTDYFYNETSESEQPYYIVMNKSIHKVSLGEQMDGRSFDYLEQYINPRIRNSMSEKE